MDKLIQFIKSFGLWLKNLNIKNAYIVYIVIALILAATLGGLTIWGINELKNYYHYNDTFKFEYKDIQKTYQKVNEDEIVEIIDTDDGIKIRLINERSGSETIQSVSDIKPKDVKFKYDKFGNLKYIKYPFPIVREVSLVDGILVILLFISLPAYFLIGCIISSILFFKYKLQPPLQILMNASDKISENELDFKITYNVEDEMGQLCESFETMRQALYVNQLELWRNIEERKRLNSAFSHDLRTPLTVLKGYSEILSIALESETINKDNMKQTVETMSKNIERLERYTYEMSRMQKLEDISVNKEKKATSLLLSHLKETGEILSGDLNFYFNSNIEAIFVELDLELVMQVYENLMANSKRYARGSIWVNCNLINKELVIEVIDDGKGFTPEGLINATNPFYKEQENVDNAHFGLGLHICRLLTEKHGGHLKVANRQPSGAKIIANFGKII